MDLLSARRAGRTLSALRISSESLTIGGLRVPLVRCGGEMTGDDQRVIAAHLEQVVRSDTLAVIVSLEEVTYLDGASVRTILGTCERMTIRERHLLVVSPTGTSTRRILDIAGVASVCPVFDTVGDAAAWAERESLPA